MLTLADLQPTTASLALKHPVTHAELGASLTLVGQDSSQYRVALASITKKRVNGATQPEDVMDQTSEMLAAMVVGWDNNEFFGGEYSREAVSAMFANPGYKWLVDQVEAFVSDRANFFR